MRKRKLSPEELEHQNGQLGTFTCGLCELTFTGRLDAWLELRAEHRAQAHPDWKPAGRKVVKRPRTMSAGEMRQIDRERAAA